MLPSEQYIQQSHNTDFMILFNNKQVVYANNQKEL